MEGYEKIAGIMAQHHDLAILRRFNTLNVKDLLYRQAELVHLESELHCIAEDDQGIPDRAFYARDWWSLAESEDDNEKRQWSKMLQIQEKLKAYNDRLLQQVQLSRLEGPKTYDLDFLRDWLERPKMGNFPLRGLDQHAWSKENETDLVAIRRRENGEPFSRWLINTVVPYFHNRIGKRLKKPHPEEPESEITEYSDHRLLTIADILGTIISCLLPVMSFVILYFVTDTIARLGITVAFTVLFSVALMLVTQARRIEIFAATSAFAGIQVVFISGNVGGVL
ncbi:uncharacterized protein K444DRAFT_520979 [Hyaloscypha bicolor E]|uniref:DUF6594 domain-containing protein n=1 Tax=Hyaloscypha bicolor E TaxID=1095630 RepID=A0A2J6TN42_9HELO|nr:uncharacterized protein K444DRAFT_520979 [Hyaloscypha bicolor E]PMD64443.1 hypothetical protein K444DRAFT_520979 [Hyaloscypha bicolor E]